MSLLVGLPSQPDAFFATFRKNLSLRCRSCRCKLKIFCRGGRLLRTLSGLDKQAHDIDVSLVRKARYSLSGIKGLVVSLDGCVSLIFEIGCVVETIGRNCFSFGSVGISVARLPVRASVLLYSPCSRLSASTPFSRMLIFSQLWQDVSWDL